MNRLLLCGALALALFACTDEALPTTVTAEPADQLEVLSKGEINKIVEAHLFATNDVYDWNAASDQVVWSALTHSRNEAALGYQPAGYQNLRETIHSINVNGGAWKTTRDELVADLLAATERHTGTPLTEEELLVAPEDGVLPILEVKILHPAVLAEFRERPEVRYLEPAGYEASDIELRSDSGCSEAASSTVNSSDFFFFGSTKVPWNFANMNIPQAWSRSQGDNIGIAVIDTGVYPEQKKLGSSFAGGSSGGRTVSKFGTYAPNWWSSRTDGPDDRCGHGTQMAGLAVAPNFSNANTVGVAWKADLRTYRATSDVVVNGSREKRGVKNALVSAGGHSGTRVISMSIGDVFSSGTVSDGIYYAYNRGKLIVAAAGTSLSWTSWYGVIFPANMNETTAVTGVRDGFPLQKCNVCHDGSKVDFVAVMQRRSDGNRNSLTLSRYNDNPGYISGSSAATATTAGIAALVWATNSGQSRAQVLDRMKRASSYYPSRNGNFGWGLIDANQAVQ